MWTRRKCWDDRDDDWCVYRDGQLVGRVHIVVYNNPLRTVWAWFKQVGHGRKGEAATLDAALEALRSAILADDPTGQ